MLSLIFLMLGLQPDRAQALEVSLLTAEGPKVLKTWSSDQMKKAAKKGKISAQTLIFEQSTDGLDLNVRADIDLVTLHGKSGRISRVPRFMIWRDLLKLKLQADGSLSSRASNAPVMVPVDFFRVDQIERIELGRASVLYPGTRLSVRTNPAASRGEKMFTQSCMACHSLQNTPKIEATLLAEAYLKDFRSKHPATTGFELGTRALRGLLAYREALASEKSSVKSQK